MTNLPPYLAAGVLEAGGFSGSALVTAVAIAKAESNLNPTAKGGPNHNGSYDWGLMQINDIHNPTQDEKTKAIPNAKKAVAIYREAGGKFTPWATFNSGSYKKNLPLAASGVKGWNKLSPDVKAKALKSDAIAAAETSGPIVSNPLAGLGDVAASITGFSATVSKVASNIGIVIVAVVLLILGVVILALGTESKLVKSAVKVAL